MSYTKSLRKSLKDKNENLYNRLQLIENSAREVLTYTQSKFPYYTPHNFLHSENVEEILNWVIPDEIKSDMNDYEIFLLLVAAWLHDLGMVASEDEDAAEVRETHHLRTETALENLHDKLNLSLAESRIAGRICRGHRTEDIFDSIFNNQFLGSNVLIRIRFLTALVRVADECDITANRTPEIIYYALKPKDASNEEFEKHLLISGIGQPSPYKLVINGVAKTPGGVEVIEGVRSRIQNRLNSVKTVLANHGVMLDTVDTQVDIRGFINKPIGFHLDNKAIVKLLIGEALYSRKDVGIRELLSNAVDTCRLRKIMHHGFKPCIKIEYGLDYVSFEDNGVGMNYEDAVNYFSKKGHSFYVSQSLLDTLDGIEFNALSKFGIGVLSSFLIADKMIIDSKKANCAPCRFTVSDLAEGWVHEEGSRKNEGTKVTLFFDAQAKELNIEKSLEHYAKNVKIPIYLINAATGKEQLFDQHWSYDIPEVEEHWNIVEEGRLSEYKPIITLRTKASGLEVTYHIFDRRFDTDKNCFFLTHGIYVGNFKLFPVARENWIALIDDTSNLVDLKVSREDIVNNKKFVNFLDLLYSSLLEAINTHSGFKKDTPTKIAIENCKKFSKLANHMFLSGFGVEKKAPYDTWPSKFIEKKTYPVLHKKGLECLDGEQIRLAKFSKLTHYKLPSQSCENHIELVRNIIYPKMDKGEAIVFEFEPQFQFLEKHPRKFNCVFCEVWGKDPRIRIGCSNLRNFLLNLELTKKCTPLDRLLSAGSFFTSLPDELKALTLELKPYEFSPSLEELSSSDHVRDMTYASLVGIELNRNEQHALEFYKEKLFGKEKLVRLSSRGYFAYDLNDSFLEFIMSKAEEILQSESMKKLIQRYLKARIMCCVSPLFFGTNIPHEYYSVYQLERIIADMLGYSKRYKPLRQRMGKVAQLYNLLL